MGSFEAPRVRSSFAIALATGIVACMAGLGRADEADVGPPSCDEPVADVDPEQDPAGWRQRDLLNIYCSRQHSEDQLANPEYLLRHALLAGPQYVENLGGQLFEPNRPHVNPVFFGPGARASDPFREAGRWEGELGRGQTQEVSFIAGNGAKIVGRLYAPLPAPGQGKLPSVVVTPGLQAYNELYAWVAEGLAEDGYLVLVIDPQGQGRSENFPHDDDGSISCLPACDNVPTNAVPETRDALHFLLSSSDAPYATPTANSEGTSLWNPLGHLVDHDRIGIAGHSMGASAVSIVGQEDPRVKAIVAFDALRKLPDEAAIATPALSLTGDYPFPLPNGVPMDPAAVDPDAKSAAFEQLRGRNVDVMLVTLRAATHYEWSYLPFPSGAALSTSRYGERVSMHYTLAWFDRYLKGDASAIARLTACVFDDSADRTSIGQGTWDAATLRNVPYRIEGRKTADRLSFYFRSKYFLDGALEEDLREACRGG